MKFMLDTDTCVALIRRRPASVFDRLQELRVGDAGISVVTLSELQYGAAKSADPGRNRLALAMFVAALEIAPLDASAAEAYGLVRARLERAGMTIGALDMLIGSHALSLNVPLVTHNRREFSRIPGLRLADWLD